MIPINIGMLDKIVTIQKPVIVQGSFAGQKTTWEDVHTNVWASKKDVSGREKIKAGSELAMTTTIFRIRYIAGITEDMAVIWEGRHYDIQSLPSEIGRQEALEISATFNNKRDFSPA